MQQMTRWLYSALLITLAFLPADGAVAQSYPSKPITIVVPFPPGGPNDIIARAIGEQLAIQLKQPVIIDNKAGATGNIGAQAVVKSAPDGYTLLMTLDTSLTANPDMYGKRMGFDPQKDLRPISTVARFSQMLVVNPNTEITSFKQFVEVAKKGINYASAGNGSPGHLTMEALQSLIGGRLDHIAYRGNAPAMVDLLGGQVPAGFVVTASVTSHVNSGKLIGLAVSGSKRSAMTPKVPTIAELGYPAGTTEFAYVLLAPAAAPEAVVQLLSTEVRRILSLTSVAEKLKALDIEPVGNTPQQAATDLTTGRAKWSKIIKERNIQSE